ncbi:MAG: hypothetical protein KA140_03405 [Caldisericia bacterium]|nr:hypothetical protein [Caldisericia bacterium]
MKQMIIGLAIVLAITLSYPDKTIQVASDTKPAMPFLIKADSSNHIKNRININSKYAVFRGDFGGNMYIDLESGDVVPEERVDYMSIDNDPLSPNWLIAKDAYFETADRYYMVNSDGLDSYAIGTDSKNSHIQVLDYRRGICARYNGNLMNEYSSVTVFKAGSGKELYTFNTDILNTDVYNVYPGLSVFDNHLVIGINSKVNIVDIETGKLELMFDAEGRSSYPRISGNLVQLWNVVLDFKTLEVKYKARGARTVLSLSDNVCYTWEIDEKGVGKYTINSYDLSTRKIKTYNLSLGHRQNDGYIMPDGRLYGVVNGIAYMFNGASGKFELVQLSSGLLQCERKFNPLSRGYNACDNGKQIVFTDGGSMYCYDTEINTMVWEKKVSIHCLPAEEDNLYFSPLSSDMVKYFDMNNPQKNLILPVEKLNRPNVQLFSMPKCIIISQKVGNTIQMLRYGFDGSEKELPVFMESNGEIQYHCCLDAGGASYLISYTKEQSKLYKLEGKTWKMVQDLENGYFGFVSNDRFIVGHSQTKLFVFDAKSGETKIIDGHPRLGNIVFVGNFAVDYYQRGGFLVIDLALGKTLDLSLHRNYIGFDDGEFWTIQNNKITKIGLDGKTEELETKIPFKGNDDKTISIANGLILYRGILYTPDGKFCQQLTLNHDSSIWTKDQKVFINYLSHGIVRAQLQPCQTYSLKNIDGSIVINNTAKEKLTGYFCLGSATEDFPVVKLGQKHTFSVEPGKSIELAKLDGTSQQLLAINANGLLDMDKMDVSPKQRSYMSYEGSQLDYDGTAWTLTLWNKPQE